MPKKVSEKEKQELVMAFLNGQAIEDLAEKFNISKVTIIRHLKKEISEHEYEDIIKKSKSLEKQPETNKSQTENLLKANFDNEDIKNNSNDPKILNENITSSNFQPIDSFFEIAPVDYEIDNSSRKELSSVSLSEVDFPRVVYMVVDKKIELEIKLLKDFPEWQFLPRDDLSRKTIEIFFDLNLAKRSCNKEQKVLKVPNTDVFRIASPLLIAKGISRIVCAENLIAL